MPYELKTLGDKAEYAGRLPRRPVSADVIGEIRVLLPANCSVSLANSNQEHVPEFVMFKMPLASVRISPRMAPAKSRVYVGEPTWSATTFSSGRESAACSIFSGKQDLFAPNSQEVRAINH